MVPKPRLVSNSYEPIRHFVKKWPPNISFRYLRSNYPAGIWCQNDVVSTSMRRHHVASTLIRRHFGTKCPLGRGQTSGACGFSKTFQTVRELQAKNHFSDINNPKMINTPRLTAIQSNYSRLSLSRNRRDP